MDATDTTGLERGTDANPADRRRHQRVGTMWMATLQSAGSLHDCMVIDLSRGGAKLVLPDAQPLADTVELVVGGFGTFRAKRVWQRGEFAGVQFLDPPDKIAAAFRNMLP
ncbi:MAG TPA: PilZ domain-containing protein [Stellaceae bacterium]|nr:PilZ domain-containing protein [Stellaceae bacterium]